MQGLDARWPSMEVKKEQIMFQVILLRSHFKDFKSFQVI